MIKFDLRKGIMMSFIQLKEIALGLPETTEEPHFEKTSFWVRKKIFATYAEKRCVPFLHKA